MTTKQQQFRDLFEAVWDELEAGKRNVAADARLALVESFLLDALVAKVTQVIQPGEMNQRQFGRALGHALMLGYECGRSAMAVEALEGMAE